MRLESLEVRRLLANTYFVDAATGNDLQSVGTFEQPFKSISRAATFAGAGDTVLIREGTYREQVPVRNSGTETAPIRFEAYQDEEVVVSGGDVIGGWTQAPEVGPDVWKTTVVGDANGQTSANTLFVNGDMELEASQFADLDRLDTDSWGNIGTFPSFGNTMQSNDLVGFGDDHWNGATILLQTRDYQFVTRTITDYNSATGTVTLDNNVDSVLQRQTNHFRIYGTTKALDKPGEWIKQGSTLYYQADVGQNPNLQEFEWKSRAFGFDIQNRQHIQIDGIEFRGASINTANSDHSLFANNKFYAYDRGGFGAFQISGDELVIRDNEFSHTWRAALNLGTTNRTDIVNNYFHDLSLTPPTRGLEATNASELLISHNTFRKFGRSIFDGYPVRSEIAYNVFEDAGKTSSDTGIFDSDGGNGNNSYSIVHHNVFRNSVPSGVVMAFYGQNANLVIHHNIIYDWPLQLQGNPREEVSASAPAFKYVYHNTIIGAAPVGTGRGEYQPPESLIEGNWNNNLQSTLERVESLGADTAGSLVYSTSDFVDFAGRDFRLAAGSDAIDAGVVLPGINDGYNGAAPDAGAIEFGESMWQVGHDFANPPSPTYSWTQLPGTNLYSDGLILEGLAGWQTPSGTPNSTDRNSWNLRQFSFTGTFRTESIEFKPGDAITRSFTGLEPNTVYTVGGGVRVGELVATGGNFDSSSGGVTTGTQRSTFYVSGLTDTPNSWVQYDNIDFGDPGQFDTLEILASKADLAGLPVIDTSVEVWLDGPNGQLLGTVEYIDIYREYMLFGALTRLELPTDIQGVHSIALRVNGANASNVALGEIRLFQSELPETDKLSLAVRPTGGALVERQLGWMDWQPGYETLQFTTGSDGSAQVTFENNGRIAAYLDRMFLLEGDVRVGDNVAYIIDSAMQSSTMAPANAAVDGDLSTFSETQDLNNSWWQTDLGGQLAIGEIVLKNRSDARYGELSNFTVSVWDSDPAAGGSMLWQQSYFSTGSVSQGGSLRIDGGEVGADGVTRLGSAFGRVIRVQLNGQNNAGNGRLSLAEVEVRTAADAPPLLNAAQGRPTQQTRMYYENRFSGAAENGVNGIVDTRADYASQITALPADGGGVWWQVDLEQATDIDQIVLINNRDDAWRMGDFRVSVWDGDPTSGGQEVWGKDYSYASSAPTVSTTNIGDGTSLRIDGVTIGSNGTALADVSGGRFVRVEYIGSVAAPHNLMTLAEVQVWQEFIAPLPGDFDLDGQVSGADLPVWQASYGQIGPTGDADFDGDSDGYDFLLWQQDLGVGSTKTLIDATLGNGSFENFSGGQGAPEHTNANRVAASFDTPGVTNTGIATIPGWTVSLERYLDGNSGNTFAGFDSTANRASDGTKYAFANKRSRATLTSDPLTQHTTSAGDTYTVQFDTGSVENSDAAFIARLIFGSQIHELGSFVETSNGAGGVAAYTTDRTFEYTASALDAGQIPVLEFVINAGPNTANGQWFVDNVRLTVASGVAPVASLSTAEASSSVAFIDAAFAARTDETSADEAAVIAEEILLAAVTSTPAMRGASALLARSSYRVERPSLTADNVFDELDDETQWLTDEVIERMFT